MWCHKDPLGEKTHLTRIYHHFLDFCSRCSFCLQWFLLLFICNFSSPLHSFAFLLLPLFSHVSNYQVAVFELLTGCIHLAEIPAPSWTGICNYRTGPGRWDNIAEETYLNIQPCFKVRLCQSATLPIALAQLCTFVDILSSCHLVSEASREGAAEVQLWRLIHWFITWRAVRVTVWAQAETRAGNVLRSGFKRSS